MKEKDRRGGSDRFTVFPFSAMGCMSQSAVSVADPSSEKKPHSESSSSSSSCSAAPTAATTSTTGCVVDKASSTPPGIVAAGVHRLMKGIKQSLSQMFAAYDEDEDEDEREMVIGYPTDVQHVGHIGWDGHGGLSKVGGGAMGMVNAFSLPSSLSLRHLEIMAMDQAAHVSA